MKRPPDSVYDEPALQGEVADSLHGTRDEVWEEPGLPGTVLPAEGSGTFRDVAKRHWEGRAAGAGRQALLFFGAVLLSGVFGMACTLLKEAMEIRTALLSAVCFAPVIEEIGKTFIVLLTLERKPWFFSGRGAVLAVCLLSGLLFATGENLLYLNVYIANPSPGVVLWRWTACTLLHVFCCGLSGLGLAKIWREAAETKTCGRVETAYPWYLAAILVHGLYNAGAVLFEVWQK